MLKVYKDNGLPFYQAKDILQRRYIQDSICNEMSKLLEIANPAWSIEQIEAPTMIPCSLVSDEYADDDLFLNQDFTMKPETTASSYAYMQHVFNHQLAKPPFCVWQASKSYRRENDQVSANVRLKEFYQLEFQCVYSEDTKKDYHDLCEDIAAIISSLTGKKSRVVPSDRLPHYSQKTMDIEVKTSHKWLEVCSISRRNDVPFDWNGKRLLNTEFAFGLDRLIYALQDKG